MNMEEMLEQIDEALDDGTKLFGRKTVIDVEKIRALIDELRLNMPSEIKQARGIVADRADIITNAKKEADAIIRNAEERAKALVAQEEITRLVNLTRQEGGVLYAECAMGDMSGMATGLLDEVGESTIVQALQYYLDYVAKRTL